MIPVTVVGAALAELALEIESATPANNAITVNRKSRIMREDETQIALRILGFAIFPPPASD
jgi:hypothetical protein